ncbi:hypothetical protein MJ863_13090 [Alcaligenes ammonioxydans]|jgi:chromosome segregation ATPase|uniref:Lipoprotein n=1 Tax=Alcaligenes ammonioxydans TaxID=2582914 RepID=A0ABX8SU33_9BURK|nr:hypothetical protein [Alcaligenes ammonioxydans]EJC61467.1 lipoprotein [Alcaligenes faecalis subsp. faecalis NCIB 8687]QBH20556.1 hypothetical protein EYC51_14230 [Alcaligenes faecalis]MCH1880520.1 hypothetical protein [Alcaligenes ammonioxydans]QXX78627.1 hypothetical protein FE795_06115 [Alcaligenes ammonioxydans]WGQ36754.1 hypothetical protein QEZ63_06320 [Alcaligenes faecalis]
MRVFLRWSPVAASLVLAGCATTMSECDPSDQNAGFLTKISCDTSGAYRQHIDTREQSLLSAQQANALFHQVYKDIQAQQSLSNASLARQRQAQTALNRSMGQLLRSLQASKGQQAGLQNQLKDLDKGLKDVNRSTEDNSPAAIAQKQQQLQQLQKDVSRLQSSLGYDE